MHNELAVNILAVIVGVVIGYWIAYVQFNMRRLKLEHLAMQQQVSSIDREIHDDGH